MKVDRLFAIFYFLLLALHLYVGDMGWDTATHITKPLLVGSLIAYFAGVVKNYRYSPFALWIIVALVFSLGGDIALMYTGKNEHFFTLGLGSFLFAQVFYSAAFVKSYLVNHEIRLLHKRGWVLILIAAYGFFYFRAIKDYLGDLVGPVLIYTLVLMLMLLLAYNRYKKVSSKSFLYISLGATLFVASDSILAWSHFVEPVVHSHILIMLTYGLAQYCITFGALCYVRDAYANNPDRYTF